MVFGDRSLFSGVIIATIFAVAALGIIIFKIDPFEIGELEKAIFFVSFFVALWGILSFVFLSIRCLWSLLRQPACLSVRQAGLSVRQAGRQGRGYGGQGKRVSFDEVFKLSFWWGLLTAILIFGLFFIRRYL
ncbi:MAG: hypothetical protein HYT63_04075 [Candidatus Yanofskybacteria bacterium]|nr:hypothetical protein [Candidatus Yanofskybacteria bacterium]